MPSEVPFCVFRGGGWGSAPVNARVAHRSGRAPDLRFDVLGVRLIREITVLLQLAEVKDAK